MARSDTGQDTFDIGSPTDATIELRRSLEDKGIRVEIDDRNEKISYKIRDAQIRKIPYVLVLGERELNTGTVSVRKYGTGDLGVIQVEDFVEHVLHEIRQKLV